MHAWIRQFENNYFKSINFTYLTTVSFVSFVWFILKENTAYQWPAMDMYTFFERYYDSSFLINDFFTNSITNDVNPRWIFGLLIVNIADLLNLHWYSIVYFFKVFLVLVMPIAFYLAIFSLLKEYLHDKNLKIAQMVIMFGIIAVIYPPISGLFSIAWWPPFVVQVAAQYLSLTIGLFSIFLCQINKKYTNIFGCLFFAIATFLHPQIGLFCFIFYFICNLPKSFEFYKKYILIFTFSIVIPSLILLISFKPSVGINTSDFVNIYALQTHSPHYNLYEFGSLTPYSWMYSFFLVVLLLALPVIYFYKLQYKNYLLLSAGFIFTYIGSILFQFFFINIYPSKIFAALSPVRFSMFGYWMILISWSLMLSDFRAIEKFSFEVNRGFLITLLCSMFVLGLLSKDDPKQEIYANDYNFYKFLSSTPKDSVFASYFSDLRLKIPLIGERAIFIGNGFPFNEKFFRQFHERYTMLYGASEDHKNLKGKWKGEKEANFYRSLTPSDFIKINKYSKLDYVVIEKNYSKKFHKYEPVYNGKSIYVYKLDSFLETLN